MLIIHIGDDYHYITRNNHKFTLCGVIVPRHSMAIAPVHGARMVTCDDCAAGLVNNEADTRPVYSENVMRLSDDWRGKQTGS